MLSHFFEQTISMVTPNTETSHVLKPPTFSTPNDKKGVPTICRERHANLQKRTPTKILFYKLLETNTLFTSHRLLLY